SFASIDDNFALTVNTRGSVVFSAPVGSVVGLASLTVRPSASVTLGDTITTSGAIDIVSASALPVAHDITSTTIGDIALQAIDAASAGQDLTVGAATIHAGGGNIVLNAGDNIDPQVGPTPPGRGTGLAHGDF